MSHPQTKMLETPIQSQTQRITHGPDETIALGQRIGQAIQSNLFIALSGDLGAGKTTFTKGLALGLGIPNTVTSPTFTLVNEYNSGRGFLTRRLVHVDLYRLEGNSAAELDGIGFGDLLDDLDAPAGFGLLVLVVEWADRLGQHLPPDRLQVSSALDERDPDRRVFTLTALGETAGAVLKSLT